MRKVVKRSRRKTMNVKRFAETNFEAVSEFQGDAAKKSFQDRLDEFCIRARWAFAILGKTKKELIGASKKVIASEGLDEAFKFEEDIFAEGAEQSRALTQLLESASARWMNAIANSSDPV